MQNLDEALVALIEKISTTATIAASDVYQMLLKQLYISVFIDALFLVFISACTYKFFLYQKSNKSELIEEVSDQMFGVIFAIIFICILVVLNDFITLIFNQDYAVLKSAIKSIK